MNQFYYANEDGTEYHPPKWWLRYVLGALLVVIGVVGPCGGFLLMTYSAMQTTGPTIAPPPGQVDVPVAEAGTMVVWIEEQDSAMQTAEPQIPADFEAIVKGPGNTVIASGKPHEDLSSSTPDASRVGAATFIAPAAGTYHVTVKGTFTMGQTVVVTPSEERRDAVLGASFLGLGCLSLVLVGGGIALLIVTGVKHARAGRSPI